MSPKSFRGFGKTGPSSIPTRFHMWGEFVGSSLAPRVFFRVQNFKFSTFSISNFYADCTQFKSNFEKIF